MLLFFHPFPGFNERFRSNELGRIAQRGRYELRLQTEATSCHAEFLSKHGGSFGKFENFSFKFMDFRFFCCFFLGGVSQHFLLEKNHPWKVLSWQLVGPRELGPGNPMDMGGSGRELGREGVGGRLVGSLGGDIFGCFLGG